MYIVKYVPYKKHRNYYVQLYGIVIMLILKNIYFLPMFIKKKKCSPNKYSLRNDISSRANFLPIYSKKLALVYQQ